MANTFGSGIPRGGDVGSVLRKSSGADYDATWEPLDTLQPTTPYLTVDALKEYLRIGASDTIDDALLSSIVAAVEAEQRARCRSQTFMVGPEPQTTVVPPDVYHAALMRGARLYVRRASPEGLVGLGELGVARVPAYDRDIDALEAPWRSVVLA